MSRDADLGDARERDRSALRKRRSAAERNSPEAYSNLGAELFKDGRLPEARRYFERAIALDPGFAKAHFKLGNLLSQQGKRGEAIASFARVLALKPDHAGAHNNLADVFSEEGRINEALPHYRRAAALKPNEPAIPFNLGNALSRQGRFDDAAASHIRAISLDPNFAAAHFALAAIFASRGHLKEAIAGCRRAGALDPNSARIFAQLTMLRMQAGDWDRADEDAARVLQLVRQEPGTIPPANLLCQTSTAEEQFRCARDWARRLKVAESRCFRHRRPRKRRKLRLGYLCADYRSHPLAHLIVSLMERHDRSAFEVFAYSVGPSDASPMRRRLEAAFDRFVDLRDDDEGDAAQRINADAIDILVDLTGYADYGRTRLLAYRPAPIQVNGIGYTGTTGADFIDYIIADEFVVPLDQQPFFTERLVHLPNCYMPSDTERTMAEPQPTRAECGLPGDGFVFCCFNNRYKIKSNFFDAWMRLLHAVPHSVLWLVESESFVKDNFRREASRRGVDASRLKFMDPVALPVFLARNRLADLFLDTLPYNAHTTANDALWAGLPVLTCVGRTFAGRVAGSLLHAIGLPELVTHSLGEYEETALRLARTPALLAELRQRLARNRSTAPLFDMKRFSRDLEAAYWRMWDTWCRGETPTPFAA